MNDGWIKLHRQMLDNPVVFKDADYLAVWIYLLLTATHKQRPAMYGGQKIMLKPGQLVTGRKKISERTGVNESKIFRILKLFESEQQIEQRKNRYGTLISILAWDEYQASEQQVNNKCTTSEQQVNTKQECKNERNIFKPPTVEEVRAYCEERKNNVNAETFVDFYQSKGWMVGKNKMKNWKAAVRNWEKSRSEGTNRQHVPEPPKYKTFDPEPEKDTVQMPKEIRDSLRRLYE